MNCCLPTREVNRTDGHGVRQFIGGDFLPHFFWEVKVKDIKDQMRAIRTTLKKAKRINAKAKAEARRIVERDEWKVFKSECIRLKNH